MTDKVELGSGKKPAYPRRLDITDMPSDLYNVTGDLRSQLCKVVNYSRAYPAKMELVAEILGYTLERMVQIHANDEAACRETARKMSDAAAVLNYTLLFSVEELKKTSMVYFPSDEND